MISKEYLEEMRKLHLESAHFGNSDATKKHLPELLGLIKSNSSIKKILDYGCGKGKIVKELAARYPGVSVVGYDPAVVGYDDVPEGVFDLVLCLDVLEHIEPEYLPDVLHQLRSHTGKLLYVSVASFPATRTLSDGRNAHLSLLTHQTWYSYLSLYFDVLFYKKTHEIGEGVYLLRKMK